uniref:Carboxylesterase type B domain-containing protein n=1 Tax=Panagrolaimus davidi TaxID=227884 RepID=A0A914P4Z3_9BILA
METIMWQQFSLIIIFAILFSTSFCKPTNPVVETPYGPIEGFNYNTVSGNDVEIFLGIPFASPPVEDLRFEKPQSPQNWTKTLQAKEFPKACATYDKFMGHANNEDCLYLNIYKPKNVSNDINGFPIMFFVHGGGFIIGDTRLYDYKNISDNIVSQGIIVVVIQYRLGPFGFFSSNDSSIPANLGLWDQLEALKFTNKIIESFNGDKNRITIVGVSAGAGSVSLLALSEHAYNLYSQILPISGSSLSQWAANSKVSTILSEKIVDQIGCDKNSTELKECLKSKNVSEFHEILKPIVKQFFCLKTYQL